MIHPLGRVDPNLYNVKYPQFPCRSMEMRNLFLPRSGGAGRDRTDDLKLAKLPLSQLSYSPLRTRVAVSSPLKKRMVGLDRLELSTSRLSGVRSNHLSYRPESMRKPAGRNAASSARWLKRLERETKTAVSAFFASRPKTIGLFSGSERSCKQLIDQKSLERR